MLTGKRERRAKKPFINNVIANASKHRLHIEDMPPVPNSYKEAMASAYAPEWMEGMTAEIRDQEKLCTWVKFLKKDAADQFLIPMRWVFAYKLDPQGYVIRFKARLVVRGDQQPEDDEDTYAATLRARTFRLMMALCCLEDLETEQYDVKTAFLYNRLRQAVFASSHRASMSRGYA
ncbi:reverse transcriptase (RNA-dependent DNA polymerase) [Hirsutella rhossiliensis]